VEWQVWWNGSLMESGVFDRAGMASCTETAVPVSPHRRWLSAAPVDGGRPVVLVDG